MEQRDLAESDVGGECEQMLTPEAREREGSEQSQGTSDDTAEPSVPRVELVAIDAIKVKERKRPLGDVSRFRHSISTSGLQSPIHIAHDYGLISGLHRLEASRQLGLGSIPCIIRQVTPLEAELCEIEENLIRSELSVLERAEHVVRRDQILEEMGRRAPAHRPGKPAVAAGLMTSGQIAEELGISRRTLQDYRRIARSIPAELRELLRSTPVAESTSLLINIARLDETESEAMAGELRARAAGEGGLKAADVREVLDQVKPKPIPPEDEPTADTAPQSTEGTPSSEAGGSLSDGLIARAGRVLGVEFDGADESRLDVSGKVLASIPLNGATDSDVAALLEERAANRSFEGIVELPAIPGASWFADILGFPVCLLKPEKTMSPRVVVLLGGDTRSFYRNFNDLGRVVVPYDPEPK